MNKTGCCIIVKTLLNQTGSPRVHYQEDPFRKVRFQMQIVRANHSEFLTMPLKRKMFSLLLSTGLLVNQKESKRWWTDDTRKKKSHTSHTSSPEFGGFFKEGLPKTTTSEAGVSIWTSWLMLFVFLNQSIKTKPCSMQVTDSLRLVVYDSSNPFKGKIIWKYNWKKEQLQNQPSNLPWKSDKRVRDESSPTDIRFQSSQNISGKNIQVKS